MNIRERLEAMLKPINDGLPCLCGVPNGRVRSKKSASDPCRFYFVQCGWCNMRTPNFSDRDMAVSFWQKRLGVIKLAIAAIEQRDFLRSKGTGYAFQSQMKIDHDDARLLAILEGKE